MAAEGQVAGHDETKILLAVEDADLAHLTTYALERQGYCVVLALDGRQALQSWSIERPNLVLVDSALSHVEGSEVCRRIRQDSPVPIIMLGAGAGEMELVRGYESGIDDYIVKPFSPRLLVLRIEALMRRAATLHQDGTHLEWRQVILGDLAIDPRSYEVHKNGAAVTLTQLEFRVLHRLACHAGSVVEAPLLAEHAWRSSDSGGLRLLKTHISHIRHKLFRAGGETIDIRAVPRVGYVLSVPSQPPAAVPAVPAPIAWPGPLESATEARRSVNQASTRPAIGGGNRTLP